MQSNKKIAALGFGELGQQIEFVLEDKYLRKFDAYFDDQMILTDKTGVFKFGEFLEYINDFQFVVCLGYKNLAKKSSLIKILDSSNSIASAIVSEFSYVSKRANLGNGVVIYPGANIDKGVIIKAGVLINNSVVISHDCLVGMSSYLSPGVVLSGNVSVGADTFIGSGVIVSNGISIGSNSVIGIGSVITQDVPDNSTVIGNPMKFLKTNLVIQ